MIQIENVHRASIAFAMPISELEENLLAHDIESFLLSKGFICEVRL